MAIRPRPMRYTEARLSRIATALLEDLDKETVDFRPITTIAKQEPEVLPTRVPNLLVNGIVRHRGGHGDQRPAAQSHRNHQRHHPRSRIRMRRCRRLMEFVPGPDFPTGGYILGRQGIFDAYTRGRGSLKLRAKVRSRDASAKTAEQIIVTEIPYQVNKSKLIEQIASAVNEKRIEGISDVQDHSDRDGMRDHVDRPIDAELVHPVADRGEISRGVVVTAVALADDKRQRPALAAGEARGERAQRAVAYGRDAPVLEHADRIREHVVVEALAADVVVGQAHVEPCVDLVQVLPGDIDEPLPDGQRVRIPGLQPHQPARARSVNSGSVSNLCRAAW